MPIRNSDVTWLAQQLQAQAPAAGKQEPTINLLVSHLRTEFEEVSGLRVVRVVRAGSLHKQTALDGTCDCDLVIMVDMPLQDFIGKRVQERLKDSLVKSLQQPVSKTILTPPGSIEVDPRSFDNQFASAACHFAGIDFDILVGVSCFDGSSKRNHAEQQRGAVQNFILGMDFCDGVNAARILSASMAETAVDMVIREEDPVKLAIVLLKQWREAFALTTLKSFVLELLALAAVHQLRVKSWVDNVWNHHVSVLEVFRRCMELLDISKVRAREPRVLSFENLRLYDVTAWADARFDPRRLPSEVRWHRLRILNPMTPNMDVLFSVCPRTMWDWSDAAQQTLKLLKADPTFVDDVFFPFPDVDGEESNPSDFSDSTTRSPYAQSSSDVSAARSSSASCSAAAVRRIVLTEAGPVKLAIARLARWREDFALRMLGSFLLELLALAAVHQLRAECSFRNHGFSSRKIFWRCLELLDLSKVSAHGARVLSFEHLGLSDPAAQGADPGAAPGGVWRRLPCGRQGRRLQILDPMAPDQDLLLSLAPMIVWEWSTAAERTLRMLEGGATPVFGNSMLYLRS